MKILDSMGCIRSVVCFTKRLLCRNPGVLTKMPEKLRRVRKYGCPGSTLPELLVVMVVGGIVFIMLFEAWNMVGNYGNRLTEKNLSENDFFTAVSRLEALCLSADSLTVAGDGLELHRTGKNKVYLYRRRNNLLVYFHTGSGMEMSDTLFRNMEGLRWRAGNGSIQRVDSLYLLFRADGREKELAFGCPDRGTVDWEEENGRIGDR